MKTLHLNADHPLQRQRALTLLGNGGLVAVPTETVYGLAADARNPDAVARVFEAKGRPTGHPLIVHIHHPDEMARWVSQVPEAARKLAQAFWPGPLTLILPRHPSVSTVVTGGLDTVALRVPDHKLLRDMMAVLDTGLAAPSANPYQGLSPTRAEHVLNGLNGRIDAVLDSGPCPVGMESTILDLSGPAPVLARPGPITADALEAVLGQAIQQDHSSTPAPGKDAIHYRPRTLACQIDAASLQGALQACQAQGRNPGVISCGDQQGAASQLPDGHWLWLPADKRAYARELYDALHRLDRCGLDIILVVTPPSATAWSDVHNRLSKATAVWQEDILSTLTDGQRLPA